MRFRTASFRAHGRRLSQQVFAQRVGIVVLEMVVALVRHFCRKTRPEVGEIHLITLPPVILFLQFPISNLVWKLAPQMRSCSFHGAVNGLSVVACVAL